jgi:hypothetical protein
MSKFNLVLPQPEGYSVTYWVIQEIVIKPASNNSKAYLFGYIDETKFLAGAAPVIRHWLDFSTDKANKKFTDLVEKLAAEIQAKYILDKTAV